MLSTYKGWRITRGSKPKFADLPRPFMAVKGGTALVADTQMQLETLLDGRKDELLRVRLATFPNRPVRPTKEARFT